MYLILTNLIFFGSLGFVDKRKEKYKNIVDKLFPDNCPVIATNENINIHKVRARHTRIKERTIPIMWNFTGKAVIKPIVENLKNLFDDSKTSSDSQKQLKSRGCY